MIHRVKFKVGSTEEGTGRIEETNNNNASLGNNDKTSINYNGKVYDVRQRMVDGEMQIKEGFKQAITGGWYQGSGIELEPAKHIE